MSGQRTTEDSILSNIPGIDDGDTGGDQGQQGSSTSAEGGQEQSTQQTDTRVVDRGQQSQQEQQRGQQEQRPEFRRRDGLLDRPDPTKPKERQLVDPVSGRVVANGGVERRLFDESQRVIRENTTLKQQIQQLQQQTNGLSDVARVGSELRMSVEEQTFALRAFETFKKDPVRFLTELTAEVKAKGYQIPFLEQGISPGIDTDAIGRMIEQKLHPFIQERQQRLDAERQTAEHRRTIDNFLSTHPDAEANLGVIAQMLERRPELTLQDAYVNLVVWCAEHGLDVTQPIQPQIDAQRRESGGVQNDQPSSNRRPLPNARGGGGGNPQALNGRKTYDEHSSWRDIIGDAMEETGFRTQ